MNSDTIGSVTDALNKGDRERVIALSYHLFADLWKSLAKRTLPPHRRRSADEDDALQEALIVLNRILEQRVHPLKTREDILRLVSRIIKFKSINLFKMGQKLEGESAVVGRDHMAEASQNNRSSFADIAGKTSPFPSAQAAVDAAAIQKQIAELDRVIARRHVLLSQTDQQIVALWLGWKSYREIARLIGVTVWDVRNTTFDFKSAADVAQIAEGLLKSLWDALLDEPGVFGRIELSDPCYMVAFDTRDNP